MMRSKYTLAAMAILASCYTNPITTYAFVAPAASSSHLLNKSFAIYANNNNIEGRIDDENDILFTSAVASGWQPDRGTFAGITRRTDTKSSTTALGMSDDAYAVIPDGGLSPCVIKVVGVGGGGCNAVSILSANFVDCGILRVCVLECIDYYYFSSSLLYVFPQSKYKSNISTQQYTHTQ